MEGGLEKRKREGGMEEWRAANYCAAPLSAAKKEHLMKPIRSAELSQNLKAQCHDVQKACVFENMLNVLQDRRTDGIMNNDVMRV